MAASRPRAEQERVGVGRRILRTAWATTKSDMKNSA
jgi:hypothetical protein